MNWYCVVYIYIYGVLGIRCRYKPEAGIEILNIKKNKKVSFYMFKLIYFEQFT